MRLKEARIKNFRSISYQVVKFDPNCRILVGINESGKSNVLKALNLLSNEPVTAADVRYELDGEEISEAYIWFTFSLDEEDKKEIYSNVKEKVLSPPKSTNAIASHNGKDITLEELCFNQKEGLYTVDLLKEKKNTSYWSFKGYTINKEWKKPIASCPPSIVATDDQGVIHPLKNFTLISPDLVNDVLDPFLEPASIDDVARLVGSEIADQVEQHLPECVFWTYSENYLLPARVPLANFISNPSSCVPLQNMFEMAGEGNIKEAFEKANARKHGVRNLLDRVARATTDHN